MTVPVETPTATTVRDTPTWDDIVGAAMWRAGTAGCGCPLYRHHDDHADDYLGGGAPATLHEPDRCTDGRREADLDPRLARHIGIAVPEGAATVTVERDVLAGALRGIPAGEALTVVKAERATENAYAAAGIERIERRLALAADLDGAATWLAEKGYATGDFAARVSRLRGELPTVAPADAVPPAAVPFTVPPAPGAVPPAAATPTAPPAVDLTEQELLRAAADAAADPSDVFAAAVMRRHDTRAALAVELGPYLQRISDADDRNGEVIAAMKLTRAARTEAVDAALSGRLMLLDLRIRDLLPTSRDAKAAWERVREPEVSGDRFVDGGSFIHSIPDATPAVWGSGEEVLWAEGEGLIVAGPQGVGKSTLAGNLVAAMISGAEVLGYPVKKVDRILYLAMDRPKQIARALRRQLGEVPEDELAQRLVVWQGPPPEDLAAHPERLLAMAEKSKANVVIVDSLKDAALGLSSDEVGAGWNRARQTVLAAGIDVLELHHDRKANDTTAPAIEKLYGSVWITSGAGSVIHLGGEPGDPIVRLSHLKQPATEVGPFDINHDGTSGTMEIHDATDLVAMARQPGGVTASTAATALFETEKPTKAEREKARRRLEKLKGEGLVSAVTTGGATMYTALSYTPFQVPGTQG
ncbi:AAA family ATPase [Mycobacterium senegalense]|uniref:AAA family ATPase n=1 Tax=Mycolicibacterium senegalense TaxID=1796 RepID=UPI00222313F6|nr:AAA family ATPase [Mycolicibacterium senegalense]MCW1823160.1 AAA family ATPase [Mycolicibacterium senegalense]